MHLKTFEREASVYTGRWTDADAPVNIREQSVRAYTQVHGTRRSLGSNGHQWHTPPETVC